MTALATAMRSALAAAANPERAPGMQAYMKSEMPYRGITAPDMRAISKRVIADHPAPFRVEGMSPLTTALLTGALAFAVALVVVVVIMLLTRKRPDPK